MDYINTALGYRQANARPLSGIDLNQNVLVFIGLLIGGYFFMRKK